MWLRLESAQPINDGNDDCETTLAISYITENMKCILRGQGSNKHLSQGTFNLYCAEHQALDKKPLSKLLSQVEICVKYWTAAVLGTDTTINSEML